MSWYKVNSLVLSRVFFFLVCFFKERGFLLSSDVWPHEEYCKTKLIPSHTEQSSNPNQTPEVVVDPHL